MIELYTLGGLDVQTHEGGDGAHAVLAQPRRAALLVYLALAGQPGGMVSKDVALALFWEARSQERARRALNQATYFLRRELGHDVVRTERDSVALSSEVWCDAAEFFRLLSEDRPLEALRLYRGDLLPGFFVQDAPAFEQWLEEERGRLRRCAFEAAAGLARSYAAATNAVEAVRWWRRARELDPYDETVVQELLGALGAVGDRPGVVREWQAYRERMRLDLDLEPSPETEALVATLSTGPGPEAENLVALPTPPGPSAGSPTFSESDARGAEPPIIEARRDRPTALRVLGAVLAGAAVVSLGPGGTPSTPTLDERRILVMEFADRSPGSEGHVLGRLAADWTIQELAEIGGVMPVPLAAVVPEAGLRTRRDGPALESRALTLAEGLEAGLLVTGSFHERDDSVVLSAQIVRVRDRRLLRSVVGPAVAREEAPAGVREIGRSVAGAVATLEDRRLRAWSSSASHPPDLEAYRLYSAGLDAFFGNRGDEALALLLAAARPEAGFTAPLLWAARVAVEHNRTDRADSILRILEPRRTALRPWDAAMLDYLVARVRGTVDDVVPAAERLVELVPDSEWLLWLASANLNANRPAAALAAHRRLRPDEGWLREWPHHWNLRTDAHHRLGEHEAELAGLDLWRARLPGAAPFVELRALAALGNVGALRARLERALRERPDESAAHLLLDASDELRVHGLGEEADRLVEHAAEVVGGLTDPPTDTIARAWLLYRTGRYDGARALLEPRLQEGAHIVARLALVAAASGDRTEALRLESGLAHTGPESRGWSTVQRAKIRSLLGDRAQALSLLRQAMTEGHGFYSWMHHDPAFHPLRGWPPYEAFMRPRG